MSTIEKVLRGVVLTAVFALPFIALYVAQSMFFPFISGKNYAFRILVEIGASAWLALALISPEYRPKRTWLFYAFGAFVVLIAISDIAGVYPFKSFWSNYERMEGWVTLAHLFAYFVIASSVLNTEKLRKYWWHTTLAVSAIVALTGVLQLAGFIPINQSGARLDARLGNSTYLGVYMLFHIFIAALFLARTWVNEPQNRRVAMWMYGGLIAINTFVLFFTATRGAILGLVGGAILAALILIMLAPRSRVAWRAGVAIAGLIVLAGVFWIARETPLVRNIEPLYRLATILEDGTTFSRFMNWGMAWEGFKERPIIGWGQENYAAVFDKYYDPDMYAQEPWFDRTHNIIFDWLIAGGILGLLAYLSLHLFALLAVWRSSAFAPYERAIFTGLFAGYLFYLLFTFDNILSYLMFVSVLVYIAARTYEGSPTSNARTLPQAVAPIAAGGAALLAVGLIWFVNVDGIRQNLTLIKAIQPSTSGVMNNLVTFKEAAAIEAAGMQEVREQLSQAAISIVGAEAQPVETKQAFLQAASDEMQKQVNDAPHNARAPFFLGIMFDHAGVYTEAKKWLDKAHEISSKKQSILFELGLNAYARNAPIEALQYFKEAYDLAPAYRDARVYYASALIRTGDYAAAEEIMKPLAELGAMTDQRIASAYAAQNRYDKIVSLWTEHIKNNPQDLDARFLLAGAYYAMGNSTAAIRELEAAKTAVPEAAAQADQLIQQVRSGK
ncbi:MAG: O-antigen ligase family protein [Minisyncoccia bacterium]